MDLKKKKTGIKSVVWIEAAVFHFKSANSTSLDHVSLQTLRQVFRIHMVSVTPVLHLTVHVDVANIKPSCNNFAGL